MLVTLIPQLTTHIVLLMPVALHLRAICHLLVITDGIANGAACYHRCFRADVSPALISGRIVFPCVSKMFLLCPVGNLSEVFPGRSGNQARGQLLIVFSYSMVFRGFPFAMRNGFQRFSFAMGNLSEVFLSGFCAQSCSGILPWYPCYLGVVFRGEGSNTCFEQGGPTPH